MRECHGNEPKASAENFHLRVAVYYRVSTNQQTTVNQQLDLERVIQIRDWKLAATYADEGISGSTGRSGRPALDALLKAATRREFDLVAVWSIDRLGRSLQHLVETVNELRAVGVDLYIHQQALDTSTPSGKLSFSVFGALAEYERELIRERVRSGLERARQSGITLGRPTNATDEAKTKIRELRSQGVAIRRIAAQMRVGPSTVYKILRTEA